MKLQGGVDNELELKGSEFRAFNFELYVIEELEKLIEESLTIYEGRYSDKKKKLLELYESLTPREKQVCVGVAQGKLNKVIAYELDIAERTVKMHRSHLLEKLEVKSPVELAFLLKSIGVLDAE